MTRLRSALLILGMLAVTGCAALAPWLGLAAAAAPVVSSALDAYAATARAIAPAASPQDIALLADLLRNRDERVVAASAACMPQPDAGPSDMAKIAEALRVSADASAKLAAHLDALDRAADAGRDGGGA